MLRTSAAATARFLRSIVWHISCITRTTIGNTLSREVSRVVVTKPFRA
jgi:hypothetical protein